MGRLSAIVDAWTRIFNGPPTDPRHVDASTEGDAVTELNRLLPRALSGEAGAAERIRGHLAGLSPRRLTEVDEHIRTRFRWIGGEEGWGGIDPKSVPRGVPLGVHVVGLASFHNNGYVREAAVRALAAVHDGSELPYLLIRLNDWALPVRRHAYDAVCARLTPEYAPWFVRDLWLVLRLSECGREDHTGFLERTRALLAGPGRAALVAGLDSPDRRLRRAAYSMLLDPPAADAEEIVTRALGDADDVVVLRGLRWAAKLLPPERLAELLPALARHPFVGVRGEALWLWTTRFPQGAVPELRCALLDPSASLRASARHHLGGEDFAGVYRAALVGASGTALRAALAGLGETGAAADAARVLPHLNAETPRARSAAVLALARLAPDESVPHFVAALGDPNVGVSKAARLALAPRARRVGADALWSLVQHGRERHARRNALLLLASLPRWESISWLLRARAEADPEVARLADSAVTRWLDRFNGSFTRPSREQLERAARSLDAVEPLLGERARMLRFLMKDL